MKVLAAAESATDIETYHYCGETEAEECDIGDAYHLPAAEPYFAIESQCLQRTPETVGEVEPKGGNPNEVKCHITAAGECLLNPVSTVSGTVNAVGLEQLDKHHLCPEVIKVHQQAHNDNESENQHVLARPLYLARFVGDSITLAAAGRPVLHR